MKKETATEAIILRSTPFKENKAILQLFTKEFGLLSAISTTKKTSYLSSMMLIEGSLRSGKSDMYTLNEPHILNTFPNIRKDFELLQLSMKLINTLSKTLVKERSVPPLFTLTKNTLLALIKTEDAKAIYLCYHLKLLLFEGLLPINPTDINTNLSETEKINYLTLATAKKFAELKNLSITPFLEEVIDTYVKVTFH